MKKYTMIVAILLLTLPMFAERVSPETARKVATTFLNNNGAKTAQLTDLTKEAGFPNLYIFNGEEGFVVMASDDCVKPILGYSLTGQFVVEGMPENVRWWLQGYDDEIRWAVENRVHPDKDIAMEWEELKAGTTAKGNTTVTLSPLLSTQWGQDSPYNNFCPTNTVTGCVATAMAQVMKYWEYPTHGIGAHSYIPETYPQLGELSADFNSTLYDWDNMANTYNNSSTSIQKTAVATLMYHCGVSVEMDYHPGGSSGASTADVATALKSYFHYSSGLQYLERSNYTDTEWIGMLKSDLDQNRPIQYAGDGPGGGHAFVCDGYDSNDYFHFNWGWNGNCDAYYTINNLNPGPGGTGSGAYGVYNDNQGAIFGVCPSECTAQAPSHLTFNQNGRNVTLSWTGASGAVSYNIYRNGYYIGNANTTTYADVALWGNNTYYVRSVDSNDELSLSSNTVEVMLDYQIPVVDDLEATLSGNTASLSWTVPEWCYPETPTAILRYGTPESSNTFSGWSAGMYCMYWGHRYLSEDLAMYEGKSIYKLSFFARLTGAYQCFVFQGTTTNGDYILPETPLVSKSIIVSAIGWNEVVLDNHILIDTSKDLWVFFYDPEQKEMPAVDFPYTESVHGSYYTLNPQSWMNTSNGYAYLIRTYLTDGTYTYNLYRDGEKIAEDICGTTYSEAGLNDNMPNLFNVKTNYYDGETTASNFVGFAKGNATLSTLEMGTNDHITITSCSALTVSGTLSNTNAANLVLEDGAQLFHNSDGVQATVKKIIEPYTTDDNGWDFIASPVTENITPSADNGLLTNSYDLYLFDQSQNMEWRNVEAGSFSTLNHKTGYLYANSGNPTLTFAGTLAATTAPTALTYDANTSFKGFNLIGNPYPCNTTITNDYYIINGNAVVLAENGRKIAPCEGVLVKATGTNQSVAFSKATAKATALNCFDIVVTQEKANLDRARVRLGEGIGMEKFSLNDNHTQICLWQDGHHFAVAYVNEQDEMPLKFKAEDNGTYTLNIERGSADLDYLHLIDNLTGDDVDLLSTPSYTFEAKTTDYASRFKLVFSICGDANGDRAFAFINNGNIIVDGEGMLQVIDMTGRIIVSRDGVHTVSTNGMVTGVYVLRLIDGDNVKTQKIVIE